jgi:hypothetical protein
MRRASSAGTVWRTARTVTVRPGDDADEAVRPAGASHDSETVRIVNKL